MAYSGRGSHARGAYPTQYTSHMGTASVKQEEERNVGFSTENTQKSNLHRLLKHVHFWS